MFVDFTNPPLIFTVEVAVFKKALSIPLYVPDIVPSLIVNVPLLAIAEYVALVAVLEIVAAVFIETVPLFVITFILLLLVIVPVPLIASVRPLPTVIVFEVVTVNVCKSRFTSFVSSVNIESSVTFRNTFMSLVLFSFATA